MKYSPRHSRTLLLVQRFHHWIYRVALHSPPNGFQSPLCSDETKFLELAFNSASVRSIINLDYKAVFPAIKFRCSVKITITMILKLARSRQISTTDGN